MKQTTLQLRSYGLWGIAAATFLFASDCILTGQPASGSEINAVVMLERLAAMPDWQLRLGGVTGPIGACFYVLGFWHVYLALRPSGKRLAFVCYSGFAAAYILLGAYHASAPYIAVLKRMATQRFDPNMASAMEYFGLLGMAGVLPALGSMLLLALLTLFKTTHYPKWFALLNPGLIFAGTMLFRYVPAPIGGYLVLGAGNVAFFLFFVLSTAVLWNGGIALEKGLSTDQ